MAIILQMWTVRPLQEPMNPIHLVAKSSFTIGRQACDIIFDDRSVSRKHAELVIDGNSNIHIEDFSRFGTFINGERVKSRRVLCNNDLVRIGAMPYELRIEKSRRNIVIYDPVANELIYEMLKMKCSEAGITIVDSNAVDSDTLGVVVKESFSPTFAIATCKIYKDALPIVRLDDFLKVISAENIQEAIKQIQLEKPFDSESFRVKRKGLFAGANFIVAKDSPDLEPIVQWCGGRISVLMEQGPLNYVLGTGDSQPIAQEVCRNCPRISIEALCKCIIEGTIAPLSGERAVPLASAPTINVYQKSLSEGGKNFKKFVKVAPTKPCSPLAVIGIEQMHIYGSNGGSHADKFAIPGSKIASTTVLASETGNKRVVLPPDSDQLSRPLQNSKRTATPAIKTEYQCEQFESDLFKVILKQ